MDKLVNERCSLLETIQIWFTKEGVANLIIPDREMRPLDGKKKEGTSAMPWSPPFDFYLDLSNQRHPSLHHFRISVDKLHLDIEDVYPGIHLPATEIAVPAVSRFVGLEVRRLV